jgi:hypothetical protein
VAGYIPEIKDDSGNADCDEIGFFRRFYRFMRIKSAQNWLIIVEKI